MATKKRIVYGASCEWGTDGSTYANIPECDGIAVPNVEQEYVEATNLESPGGYREYVPGLKDAGEITIPGGYAKAKYSTAHGYMTNGTLVHFRTTLPVEADQSAGDVFAFTGYVRPVLNTDAVGEILSMDLVVRISGAPTFTEGALA